MICPYERLVKIRGPRITPYALDKKTAKKKVDYIRARCGRCVYCKSIVKLQWVWRMEQEMKDWHPKEVAFSTLTYSDDHRKGFLDYSDLQYVFREYRRSTGNKFRYFAIGEYGAKTGREHFHVLTFGVKDLQQFHERWTKGFTHPRYYDEVPPVQVGHLNYLVNYLDKPMYDLLKQQDPDFVGNREMRHMSQGIGKNYKLSQDQVDQWYMEGQIMVSTEQGYTIPIPRYWTDQLRAEMDDESKRLHTKFKVKKADKARKKLLRNLEAQGVDFQTFINRVKWQEKHLANKRQQAKRDPF